MCLDLLSTRFHVIFIRPLNVRNSSPSPLFTIKNASISDINIEKASIELACYPIRSQAPRKWSSSLHTISKHQYCWRNNWSSDNPSHRRFFNTSTPNWFVPPNARKGMYVFAIHSGIYFEKNNSSSPKEHRLTIKAYLPQRNVVWPVKIPIHRVILPPRLSKFHNMWALFPWSEFKFFKLGSRICLYIPRILE